MLVTGIQLLFAYPENHVEIWSSKLPDNKERKKTPLSHEVVCFQMLDFETSNSKSEVSKSNS